jgi:capsular polysaccharide biosynthesis protein
LIADVAPEEWSRNPHVIAAPEAYSHVSAGVYLRDLKAPVTRDGVTCLARHQFFAPAKYAAAFASHELASALGPGEPAVSNGVAFTAIANHWHFVIDGLGCLRDLPHAPRALLVDSELSPGQVDFVQRFAARARLQPFASVLRLPPGLHRFENAAFPTRRKLSSRVEWVRKVLEVERPVSGTGRRLFVLRNAAASRRLVNQESLARMLEARFGFEIVDPAGMTLDEQLAEFHDATIVVGPHGAALTNFVFAARPRMLVEIFHTEMQAFYHALCHVLGARHYALQGAPLATSADAARADNADFAVDEAEAAKVVGSLLAAG